MELNTSDSQTGGPPRRQKMGKMEMDTSQSPTDGIPLSQKMSRRGLPLIPQPSDDPFDPLNWSSLEKTVVLAILCCLAFVGTCHAIMIAPAFGATVETFGEDFNLTTYLVGAPLLSYGVASLFWVAIGNKIGVKKTFAGSMLIGGLLSVWAAKASSFGQLVAARTIISFFLASPETLGPQACGDVFFLSDRAAVVGLFTAFQGTGFSLGTLVGAFIVQNLGWRWVQWVITILSLAIFLLVVLFYPETQYTRNSSVLHCRKRTYVDTLRFWKVSGGGEPKVESFVRAFLYPFRYVPHPVVILITVYFSIYVMVVFYLLTTNSIVYQAVYNFSLAGVGFTAFAPFLGALLSQPVSGFLNDWWVSRRRQKIKFIPEMRIPFLAIAGVLGPFGVILFGCAVQNELNWFVPLIGSFSVYFGFVSANIITFSYLVDVYLARTDCTLVIVNGFKVCNLNIY